MEKLFFFCFWPAKEETRSEQDNIHQKKKVKKSFLPIFLISYSIKTYDATNHENVNQQLFRLSVDTRLASTIDLGIRINV